MVPLQLEYIVLRSFILDMKALPLLSLKAPLNPLLNPYTAFIETLLL